MASSSTNSMFVTPSTDLANSHFLEVDLFGVDADDVGTPKRRLERVVTLETADVEDARARVRRAELCIDHVHDGLTLGKPILAVRGVDAGCEADVVHPW